MTTLAIIYLLGFSLTLIIGLNANKINYENKSESKFLGAGFSLMNQKNKYRFNIYILLITFSKSIIWFIAIFVGFFFLFKIKKIKIELIKVHAVSLQILYAQSEILVILLMLITSLAFYATIADSNLIILSKFIAWISILYCLLLNLSYLFFKNIGLLNNLKNSIFNIVQLYIIIVFSMLCIYIMSYSVIVNENNQNISNIKNIFFDFIAINNIWLWLSGKIDQLTQLDLFMSINSSIFSISVLSSIKYIFQVRRSDNNFITISYCQLGLGNFIEARKTLKKLSEKNNAILLYHNSIIDLATNKIADAITNRTKALSIINGSKYINEIVLMTLLEDYESQNLDTYNINSLIDKATSQEMHPYFFLVLINKIEQHSNTRSTLNFLNKDKLYSTLSTSNSTYQFIKLMEEIRANMFEDEDSKNKASYKCINLAIHLKDDEPLDLLFKYIIILILSIKLKKYPEIEDRLLSETIEVVTKISFQLNKMDMSELMLTTVISEFNKNIVFISNNSKLDTLVKNLEYEIEEILNLEENKPLKLGLDNYIKYSRNLSKSTYKKMLAS